MPKTPEKRYTTMTRAQIEEWRGRLDGLGELLRQDGLLPEAIYAESLAVNLGNLTTDEEKTDR